MTEASGGGGRAEMERRLVQRSLEDDSFRQRLLDDPKGTVEQELGSRLPEGVEVRVLEESAQTIYLVLPSASPFGEGGELSDEALSPWPAAMSLMSRRPIFARIMAVFTRKTFEETGVRPVSGGENRDASAWLERAC